MTGEGSWLIHQSQAVITNLVNLADVIVPDIGKINQQFLKGSTLTK